MSFREIISGSELLIFELLVGYITQLLHVTAVASFLIIGKPMRQIWNIAKAEKKALFYYFSLKIALKQPPDKYQEAIRKLALKCLFCKS